MVRKKDKARVVIPIYKNSLTINEITSLERAIEILSKHPIVVIKPRSLDIDSILNKYPMLSTMDFDDSYFKGIAGYNRLMLSREFYQAFADTKYVLIYQLDAYVFADCLDEWCDKDYDYVGAPWLEKPAYRLPLVSKYRRMQLWWMKKQGKPSKQEYYDKVGNGGFSLRKVDSFLRVIDRQSELVSHYANHERSSHYNEDVFWAMRAEGFRYPSAMEALRFAFDKYPAYCYRLTHHELPFGCHAWYKRKMRGFWRKFIPFG